VFVLLRQQGDDRDVGGLREHVDRRHEAQGKAAGDEQAQVTRAITAYLFRALP